MGRFFINKIFNKDYKQLFYSINSLSPGMKIIQDGEPCIVIHNEFVKPGKGQVFNRIKFRMLISGKSLEKTFKSNDSVLLADVVEVKSLYLYNDTILWYFMECENFNQIILDSKIISNNFKWLVSQVICIIILWNDKPISLVLPNFVNLNVVDDSFEVRGNTVANSGAKLVKMSTGVLIKVPLFIQIGDMIKIDTRSGEYISRIK